MTGAPPAGPDEEPGLLLIAHGSRDPRHARAIGDLAAMVRAGLPGVAVEIGFLSLSEPSVTEAYGRLLSYGTDGAGGRGAADGSRFGVGGNESHRGGDAAAGADGAAPEIRVVPLFLSAGHHVHNDVPQALAAARRAFPARTTLTVARALGPDRLLDESYDRRIREAGCWPDDPELELVPAGATRQTELDPAALAAPRAPGVLRRLVLARFLAPGLLPDRARDRAAAAGVPITEPLISQSLGPAPELVRLVRARYRDGGAGTAPAAVRATVVHAPSRRSPLSRHRG
jgi:sirohydrochlorin ferrochelatase